MPAGTSWAGTEEAPGMPYVTWSYSAAAGASCSGDKGRGAPFPSLCLTQAPLSSRPLLPGSKVTVCVTRDAGVPEGAARGMCPRPFGSRLGRKRRQRVRWPGGAAWGPCCLEGLNCAGSAPGSRQRPPPGRLQAKPGHRVGRASIRSVSCRSLVFALCSERFWPATRTPTERGGCVG